METEVDYNVVPVENLQPKWENAPTVRDLHGDYKQASSDQQMHIAHIQHWRDAMNMTGVYTPKAPAGRSKVSPKVIRKAVEWRIPALTEPFLSTPDLFNIRGVTHMDQEAARQNQYVLNNQFNTKINKRKFIDDVIKAVVEDGTCIIRTGWDEQKETVKEVVYKFEYSNTPDARVAAIYQQLAQMEAEAPMMLDKVQPAIKEGYEVTKQTGQFTLANLIGSEEIDVEKTVVNQPTAEVCIIENVVVDPTCNGDIDNAMFVVYSYETSKAELKAQGRYKNLDAVRFNKEGGTDGDHVSNDESSFTFRDEARNKVTAYEYWGYWDVDGSGDLTPIVATYIDNVMIQLEENPFPDGKLPFVAIPYNHVVGSIYGQPDAPLLEDNQKVVGAVTRGMIDLLAQSSNSQQGVRKGFLDAINKRRFQNGQHYEFNDGHPDQSIYMHKFPEIPASAYNMLQLQNNEAESMSGVKAFSNGISGQALGETATGIRNALDASSKRELAILRRIADGICKVGRRFIAMNSVFLSEQEVVRITDGRYVPVSRDDLAGNFDLELTISTAEADAQKAQELAFMVQTVGNSVDPKITYRLMADIADLRKMPETANDLRNYQPQPNPLEEQKLQLELALLQAQVREAQLKGDKLIADTTQSGSKSRNLDADTDLKKLDFLEEESGVNHERKKDEIEAQANANARMKILESALTDSGKEETTKEQA